MFLKGLEKARLADARLAGDQHQLPSAFLGQFPAVEQDGALMVAIEERHEAHPAHRREAALGLALAGEPEGLYRLGDALQRLLAEVGKLIEAAAELACRAIDDDAVRLRQGEETCGDVRRIADRRDLLCRPL